MFYDDCIRCDSIVLVCSPVRLHLQLRLHRLRHR
nr:MAG TPA: NEUROTOXIN B-IV, TOXIN, HYDROXYLATION [Caudoviricetes sp.]